MSHTADTPLTGGGETPGAAATVQGLVVLVHIGILASPFLLMGGGLLLVGLMAVAGPKKDPELVICLPAGLALLGVIALIAYAVIREGRRSVASFRYAEGVVEVRSKATGTRVAPSSQVRVRDVYGRNGQIRGWSLRFPDGAGVFLPAHATNAAVLVTQLRDDAGRTRPSDDPRAPQTGESGAE